MADVKISELTALASASVDVAADVIAVVDTSVPQTKKIAVENLLAPIVINKASAVITNLGTVTTADINGGTIDGSVIGGATAAAGSFTTLTATGGTSGATAHGSADELVLHHDGHMGMSFLTPNSGGRAHIYFGTVADNNIGSIVYDGDTNYLALTTNAVERLRITSAGVFQFKAVDGGAESTTLSTNAAGHTLFGNDTADRDMNYNVTGTGTHYFGTAAGNMVTFNSSGNIGVGTTSPSKSGIDISWGGYTQAQTHALTIGANIGDNTTRTDNGRKMGQISGFHYDNQEDRISLMRYDADSSTTELLIGGTSELCGVTTLKFLTASSITATPVERMQIDSHGTLTLNEHTTDASKSAMLMKSTKQYIDDEHENFTLVGTSSLIIISDTTSNDGGVFFASYNSSAVTVVADPASEMRGTDSDNYICCFKGAGTNSFQVKNRRGSTKYLSVAVIGCGS